MSTVRFLAVFGAIMIPAMAADLRIRLTDASGQPVYGRVEVRGEDGKMYQPPDGIVDAVKNARGGELHYLGSFVMKGEARLVVPPGGYLVVGERGLEHQRVEQTLEVTEKGAEVTLRVAPWIRMNERNWWSADLHVHRPVDQAPALALAEDVNLTVLTTIWNQRNYWSERGWPAEPVTRVTPNHWITLLNAEDERGGGAWMLNALQSPVPIAVPGRWYPVGLKFIREARAQRTSGGVLPWIDCEKPTWWEVPVIMALETPDSLGVLHNHFMQYGIDANEAWGRPRDQEKFAGAAGFVDYSLGLYYRYLNLGFRLAPSAGSASGVLPNPVGYSRVYARFEAPLSVEKFYRAMRQGDTFVTNGPMLWTRTKAQGNQVEISVEASAREPIDRVEIVANGEVLKRWDPAGEEKQFSASFSFRQGRHSWVAARCFLKPGSTIRLAHSSPTYLKGKWDAAADARYFTAWIDELIQLTTDEKDRFANDAERAEVLSLYRQARAFYAAKGGLPK